MAPLKPVGSWLGSFGFNEIQEFFAKFWAQFGKDIHLLSEEKGISFHSLLPKDVALLRLPALRVHYSYTAPFALGLLACLTHLRARADFRAGWSNWWTSSHIWTGVEHVFFQGSQTWGISRTAAGDAVFLASLWAWGSSCSVGMPAVRRAGSPGRCWQSWSGYTASCWEALGGIAQPTSVKMNGVATALVHIT